MAVLTIYLTGFGLTSILMILALSAVRAQLRGDRITVRDVGSMVAKCVFWFGFWPFWGWTELRRHIRGRP